MEAKKKLFNSLNKRQSYKEKFKTFWKKLKKCKYIYIHEIHIDMYMKNKLENIEKGRQSGKGTLNCLMNEL